MKAGSSKNIDRAVREEAVLAEILENRPEVVRQRLLLAALVQRIDASAHYIYESCASVGEWGERHGFSAREARLLAAVGKAVEVQPAFGEKLIEGKLTFDAVGVLGKILDCPVLAAAGPELAAAGADWIERAEQISARQLEREAAKALKEVAEGEPVSVLVATMTATGREKFERARVIACRKENKVMDEGETVEVLADHYLDSFDEERVTPGTRRLGDTSGTEIRTVPAEVRRAVRERSGGMCEYPLCENEIFLDLDHDKPHCRGGSQEADNLDDLCKKHHRFKHRGWIRKEVQKDGTVIWFVRVIREPPERDGGGRIRPERRPDGSGPDPPG